MTYSMIAQQAHILAVFLASGLVLWVLGRYWPVGAQRPFFNRELLTNIAYQLLGPLYAAALAVAFFAGMEAFGVSGTQSVPDRLTQGAIAVQGWPLALQVLVFLLARDFLQYWVHRLLHMPDLWHYHAIHHAPEDLEWHHANRFHPVNFLLYVTAVDACLYLVGLPMKAALIAAPVTGFFSLLVHSNLKWTFGPFRYVLASPVYHRWHHSCEAQALDKNFAPNFPIWDLLFGTYYMPRDALPTRLGIGESDVPRHFWGQMAYPFRKGRAATAELLGQNFFKSGQKGE